MAFAARVLAFAYGVYVFLFYSIIAFIKGGAFRKPTERENLELSLAQDRFWNLSKSWAGLSHQFLALRNGFKFHYLTSNDGQLATHQQSKQPLVIFLHGFPDSWAIWRHILASSSIRETSTVVAVDLPGYGGTDSLEKYTATEVLESLCEFIIAIREKYGVSVSEGGAQPSRKVIIVAHDWGAVLAYRLAAEAPQLADRFIVSNGPLISLMRSNLRLVTESSAKMLKTFLREPWRSRSCLLKSLSMFKPVISQLRSSGYVFAFQLPLPLVRFLGYGQNYAFLKAVHVMSAGAIEKFTVRDAQESMASTLGPSLEECKTLTDEGERYPQSVVERQKLGNFIDTTAYYRHGAGSGTWTKSLETISALFSIWPDEPRRTSSGTGVFDITAGALKANATILWGQKDIALNPHITLEGIGDYLVHGSQVVVLPRTGHYPQVEMESRRAVEKVVEWAVLGERSDLESVVRSDYPDAKIVVQK